MPHYTSTDTEVLTNRITFDFIAQLANRLETDGIEQQELARRLNVSEGAVSQVLNLGRMNLNLKTMVQYARALGMKMAVVAYDDGDPNNANGPVGANIFALSWEKLGKPKDVWSLRENFQCVAANHANQVSAFPSQEVWPNWMNSWMNTSTSTTTVVNLPLGLIPIPLEERSIADA
jgi:transcriptional regulator with XRE-family HTH domain